MAILIYYVVGRTHYQAVLIAEESVVNRGGKGENRLWKRVTPTVTEFAWLPPNIAESFCKNALYQVTERTYHAFDTPHLGLDTKNFVADVLVEDILYLGDTRSADDLAVFTKMAPERLCLGCGLRVDEPFAPIATGERKKLFYAAQKLLTFVLHEVSAQTIICKLLITSLGYMTLMEEGVLEKGDGHNHHRQGYYRWWGPLC